MLKLILFFLFLLAFTFGISWLFENDGQMTLNWFDSQITTSTSFMIFAIIVIFFALSIIYQVIASIFGFPSFFKRKYSRYKTEKTFKTIETSVAALLAGDNETAEKSVKLLRNYGGDNQNIDNIADVISAKLSAQKGDLTIADKKYQKLSDDKKTKYYATKGLLENSFLKGEIDESIKYAEEAYKINPQIKDGAHSVLELYKKAQYWTKAEDFLNKYSRSQLLVKDKYNKIDVDKELAICWFNLAKKYQENHIAENKKVWLELSLDYSEKAYKKSPNEADYALLYIDSCQKLGKDKKAKNIAEKFWSINPSAYFLDHYMHSITAKDEQELFKKRNKILDKLASINHNSVIDEHRKKILLPDYDSAPNVETISKV